MRFITQPYAWSEADAERNEYYQYVSNERTERQCRPRATNKDLSMRYSCPPCWFQPAPIRTRRLAEKQRGPALVRESRFTSSSKPKFLESCEIRVRFD